MNVHGSAKLPPTTHHVTAAPNAEKSALKIFDMKEEWRDIPGYEGYYQASNLGRIKSMKRIVCTSNGHYRTYKEKIKSSSTSRNSGYQAVGLSVDGVVKVVDVHVLVARSFISKSYSESGFVVDHIDRNKHNNRLDNLRIVDKRKNAENTDTSRWRSEHIGVSYLSWGKRKKKWRAQTRVNGKSVLLGIFKTQEEAAEKYNEAAKFIRSHIDVSEDAVYEALFWVVRRT